MARKQRGVAFIAAADLMACFVAIMLLVVDQRKADAQDVIEQMQEAATLVLQATQSALEATQDQRDETQEEVRQLEERLKSLRKQKWEVVKSRWKIGSRDTKESTSEFYCLRGGLFTDPLAIQPLSKAEVLSWLHAQPGENELLIYIENGANDQFLQMMSILLRSKTRDRYSTLTLPSDFNARE